MRIKKLLKEAKFGNLIAMYKLGQISKRELLEIDHDCSASPEDGCSICYELVQLGLLPDYDGFDLMRAADER